MAVSTIADFERGQREPVQQNLLALRDALVSAGAQLKPGGGVDAPPQSGRAQRGKPTQPVRLVDSTDIAEWSARRDGGQARLPELLSRLILSEVGRDARLRFPTGDSVQFSGWDGVCETETFAATPRVPAGRSVWEVSTRKDVAKKGNADFRKRTEATDEEFQRELVFFFVTTKRWPQKDQRAKGWKQASAWRDVRILDCDDLVQWIELHPAVGNWFASLIRKRPDGSLRIEDVWEEWSLSTAPPMSVDLLLTGRDEDAARIHRWLREPPKSLPLQAESVQEAISFLYAAIDCFPKGYRDQYFARVVVPTTSSFARQLGDSSAPLIVVLTESDPGLAERLCARGHHVFVAYGGEFAPRDDLPTLERPKRADIEWALTEMGVEKADAERLAQDSGRSLSVLRRLMRTAPGRAEPLWARGDVAIDLIPALFAGAWDERNEADQQILAALGDGDFISTMRKLSRWFATFESPLRRIGSGCRIASPRDAWALLAPYLTESDLNRFVQQAFRALSGELVDEAKGVAHSHLLLSGLARTAALLATFPHRASSVKNAENFAHQLVRGLLQDADEVRWRRLARELHIFAEASPEVFLDCLDRSLKRPDRPVMGLFRPNEAMHADLLWALEMLAWNTEYLQDVTLCLARLAKFDPQNSRFVNRPANSLREVFLLWYPQTTATLKQRIRIIDALRKNESEAAWRLMIELIPSSDSATPSQKPRWRDWQTDNPEPVTYGLIAEGANAILDRILADVGADAARWSDVIDLLPQFDPTRRKEMVEGLTSAAQKMNDTGERELIRKRVRHTLHLHRQIADADWAIPAEELEGLQKAYDLLEPSQPIDRCRWLFDGGYVELPNPGPGGMVAEHEALGQVRVAAVETLIRDAGESGVLRLVDECSVPFQVGIALGAASTNTLNIVELMDEGFLSSSNARQHFAEGILKGHLHAKDSAFADLLIARIRESNWPTEAAVRALLCLNWDRKTWELVRSFGSDVDDSYWRQVGTLWINDNQIGDVEFAARRLMQAKRARAALGLLWRAKSTLNSETITDVLLAAAQEPESSDMVGNDRTMHEWHVEELLKELDEREGFPQDRIAQIELAYLSILRFARMRPEGRPPRALNNQVLTDAKLFADLIFAIYRADSEQQPGETPAADTEEQREKATQAYELLSSLSGVPGWDGEKVDGEKLESWVAEVRKLCAAEGRADVGDLKIGELLAQSPVGSDKVWPAEAVREIVENSISRYLEEGMQTGRYNLRGVTSRMYGAGGDQERDLAMQFRSWSRALKSNWPQTSNLLEGIARMFDRDGRWHDDQAASIDWN